mgnify:CR=1 FL=1
MEQRKLTNSMRSKFNACHRAYKIAYVDLIRPAKASDALSFGTAMHALLEAYWGGQETMVLTGDDYTDATLRCLFEGYKAKWEASDAEKYERVGAEFGFEAPLMNPETGGVSKTWVLAGKIDAIAKDKATGKHIIVEHKTTSQDIGPGSDYWKKLPIDGQVSGYYVGASTLGYEVDVCLYDVIRKPTIRPYKATPEENRKYKKDGTLYAGQHECDETPEEWKARLMADIAERPDYYFQRVEVVRSESDLSDYLFDMWAVGREIADAERIGRWSRNPNACSIYGSCEYFDVCTGCASLDDVTLFRKAETPNEELDSKLDMQKVKEIFDKKIDAVNDVKFNIVKNLTK